MHLHPEFPGPSPSARQERAWSGATPGASRGNGFMDIFPSMHVLRIAAFSDGDAGGNPAGVEREDMGAPSLIRAEIPDEPGSSVRVSGTARVMTN